MQIAHPTVRRFDVKPDVLEAEIAKRLSGVSFTETGSGGEITLLDAIASFEADKLIKGRIIAIEDEQVLVDIGAKAEGIISIDEFEEDELVIGGEIEVLTEQPDEYDPLPISKRKADRKRRWNEILGKFKEGDIVTGTVARKIKGGLLIDIGVPVFLPASQVSIRRTKDISEYMGQQLDCEIIKIDEARENIVVSRRKMQEEQREKLKQMLLEEIQPGEVREGIVKNIAEFGAFVDLGGIDGLLHITDM
ncbi:MAG: S1 RNA-binding domain-containing protein, partial [Planctomycetes bacterium]|nr:S1 RNA-binding domain-containing protein [Planctomycetota bacterium]